MAELITLTMNPAIDVTTSVREMKPTSKLRTGAVTRSPGGGGINVARVVKRFGHGVVALYPAGGPTGERLKQLVTAEGVESSIVELREETRESFTVLEDATGREFRFVLPGPRFSEKECEALLARLDALDDAADTRFVILSGSLPEGVPKDFYARAARVAHSGGAKVVVDSYGEALGLALKSGGLALIKPSLRELSELLGQPLDNENERLAACRRIVAEGSAELVALTLGADGAMLVGRDLALFAPAVPVEVRSAVGAGDSFLGAMAVRLAEGKTPEEAFRTAVAAGSAALLTPGTTLCHKEDVERLTPEVAIRRIG